MLLTKVHRPTVGKNLVQRTQLLNKLNKQLKQKLILVSAPAGFGKTTVITSWIDTNKLNAAWFAIDRYDNDLVGFFSYLIAAVQTVNAALGKSANELLNSPNPPRAEAIVNLLINDVVQHKQEFVLVLDDFHLIDNPEICSAISYMLDYLPERVQVVIISRSDPNLPLAKLRSQQQLQELRSADLSFSSQDIATLFNKNLNTKLTINDVKALENKTEGWIAGLQLAALSMQGHTDKTAFVQAFAGNNRYIMDYLIEEVLKVQTEDVKEFLLKTSILEQYSAPLCNALLDRTDSQEVIEQLESNNMFVFPLDSERHWYRYHHLFADLLKQRLQQLNKLEIHQLHSKACEWYEQNNMMDLAIEHALIISNYEKCLSLLDDFAETLWLNGKHDALLKYGEVLPNEIIKKKSNFCLYYAWILVASGYIKKAEAFLLAAEQKVITSLANNALDYKTNKTLLGKISVALAYLYSHDETSDKTLSYCETAMKHLPDNNSLWLSWALFSYGVSYFSAGQLQQSIEAFNKAFDFGKKTGNIYLLSTIVLRMAENEQVLGNYKSAYKRCSDLLNLISDKGYTDLTSTDNHYAALHFILGISQFSWAQFDEAFENISIAYKLSRGVKDVYLRIPSLMVYSFVLKELNNPEADAKMAELDEVVKQEEVPTFLLSMYKGWKIYLLLEKNALDEAQNLAKEYGLSLDAEKNHLNDSLFIAYARLLIKQNKIADAKRLIDELLAMANKSKRIERIIELNILLASIHNVSGDLKEATHYLLKAMELASDQNLISFFVFNADSIKDVIDEAIKIHATQKTKIPAEYISNLKKAIGRKNHLKQIKPLVDLSARELETLRLIAEGLTNQQIADKLFISLNTVKTHLKNLNLKLEANNRNDAAQKAKALNLI